MGGPEAAANLGERDVIRLAAYFSGESVGGGVGVFERLFGRDALQNAQAEELGEGDDDGRFAAEVDDLLGGRHRRVGGGIRTDGLGGSLAYSLGLLPWPVPRLDPSRDPD